MNILSTDPMSIFALVAIAISVIALVWAICILHKRPERRRELRHYIDLIEDPSGCRLAVDYYRKCTRIVVRYGIELSEAGFTGELTDLWVRVGYSLGRADRREELTCSHIISHAEHIPTPRPPNVITSAFALE